MTTVGSAPAYLDLCDSGELETRINQALAALEDCRLCPRNCGVDRLKDQKGVCRTGRRARVANFTPHFGEESVLVGRAGSGAIFFSNCNLGCVFCQNYDLSHLGEGDEVSAEELADMMVGLQKQGCHNINFVTPSHVAAQILEALPIAIKEGLKLPLVYNSNGYDKVETLILLDGVFDIYMPDFKFWYKESAQRLVGAADYPERARRALKEMHRQVGDLVVDQDDIARHGLLVRHLVMPGGLEESRAILEFIAKEISSNTYINVMDQYRPCGRAGEYPPIDHALPHEDYEKVLVYARQASLKRFEQRDLLDLLRRLWVV